MVAQDSATTSLTTNSASQAYGSEQSTTFTVTVDTGNGESLPASEKVTVEVGSTSCLATLTPSATGGRGRCPIGPHDFERVRTPPRSTMEVTPTSPGRVRPPRRSR